MLHIGGDDIPWISRRGDGKGRVLPRTTAPSPSPESWPTEKSPLHLPRHSLLHDEGKAVLALKGVIELDQVHMAELVHDGDLVLHILLAASDGRGVSKKWVRKMSQLCLPRHTHAHILLSCSHIRSPTHHPNQVLTIEGTLLQSPCSTDRKPEAQEGSLEVQRDPAAQGVR